EGQRPLNDRHALVPDIDLHGGIVGIRGIDDRDRELLVRGYDVEREGGNLRDIGEIDRPKLAALVRGQILEIVAAPRHPARVLGRAAVVVDHRVEARALVRAALARLARLRFGVPTPRVTRTVSALPPAELGLVASTSAARGEQASAHHHRPRRPREPATDMTTREV